MLIKQQIELSGDVAEIIVNEGGNITSIFLNHNSITINLKDDAISLGEKVVLKGNLFVESITVNGIKLSKIETN